MYAVRENDQLLATRMRSFKHIIIQYYIFVCFYLCVCIVAKTVWKKRYFEEKKKTVSLEERCNQLRYEVEVIHKKILSSGDAKGTYIL